MAVDKIFKMKNYTTDVPASRSIGEIEKLLSHFGAAAVMKEFTSDGRVHSLSFKLQDKAFKLPANINGVKKILYTDVRPHHSKNGMKRRDDRANRVAWRILKDWIHAQLSLIASGQAHPEQIFLPYLYDGKSKRTLYETYVEGKLLPQNAEEK